MSTEGCKLCGEPREDYQVFCGAACCVMWEDGIRTREEAKAILDQGRRQLDPGPTTDLRDGRLFVPGPPPGKDFTWKQNLALLQFILGTAAAIVALLWGANLLALAYGTASYWAWEWLRTSTEGGIGP